MMMMMMMMITQEFEGSLVADSLDAVIPFTNDTGFLTRIADFHVRSAGADPTLAAARLHARRAALASTSQARARHLRRTRAQP